MVKTDSVRKKKQLVVNDQWKYYDELQSFFIFNNNQSLIL
jgi:hypothetical protein